MPQNLLVGPDGIALAGGRAFLRVEHGLRLDGSRGGRLGRAREGLFPLGRSRSAARRAGRRCGARDSRSRRRPPCLPQNPAARSSGLGGAKAHSILPEKEPSEEQQAGREPVQAGICESTTPRRPVSTIPKCASSKTTFRAGRPARPQSAWRSVRRASLLRKYESGGQDDRPVAEPALDDDRAGAARVKWSATICRVREDHSAVPGESLRQRQVALVLTTEAGS